MRYLLLVLSMLLLPASSARADVDVSVAIAIPGVRIGINVPAYPRLVRVPGYPVYYDPAIRLNLFFYDGLYWVFQSDRWYVSSWYNGPWDLVDPYDVPAYILLVPVRYYRVPPPYFHGWRVDAPPRWDTHWGREWQDRRKDWEHPDRHVAPPPAPLPSYQRKYSGKNYPRELEQQRSIRTERYRYEPREAVTQKHYQREHPQGGAPGQQKKRDERGQDRR
jgi:hypothetical protein